jgi:diadenosine tetraphosphate (Ap4A) HIT family hydrolase
MHSSYDPNNIFAKILEGKVPCNKVYEDDFVLAFHDVSPAAPVHVLVIPKGNYISFADFTVHAGEFGIANFFATVGRIANELGLAETGYRLITNHGRNASQSVPHFHVHILGGTPLGGLLAGDPLNR